MANPAKLTLGDYLGAIETGSELTVIYSLSGVLSLLNGAAWTPQNLTGCAIIPADQSIRKNTATNAFDSGVTSVETIASGDGEFSFVANTPPKDIVPGYPEFGGRMFHAGLTTLGTVTTEVDITFGLKVWQHGVEVWEAGIYKRRARSPRTNAVYTVAVVNG